MLNGRAHLEGGGTMQASEAALLFVESFALLVCRIGGAVATTSRETICSDSKCLQRETKMGKCPRPTAGDLIGKPIQKIADC